MHRVSPAQAGISKLQPRGETNRNAHIALIHFQECRDTRTYFISEFVIKSPAALAAVNFPQVLLRAPTTF